MTIHQVIWHRQITTGGSAGDRTTTLETAREGLVYRIQTYIAGTGGKGPVFDYQVAVLNRMVNSFTFGP